MENHILTNEFPEYVQKIAELKTNDESFRKMYVNYKEVNALIQHDEECDGILTSIKTHNVNLRKRLLLKDSIYSYLHSSCYSGLELPWRLLKAAIFLSRKNTLE